MSNSSRIDYIEIILKQIKLYMNNKNNKMIIKFLLTIDNSKPYSEAEETIEYAINHVKKYKNDSIIVGIDFAPKYQENNHILEYKNLLNKARENGLKITVHFAEYLNPRHNKNVLDFKPDRLGHAINLTKYDLDYLIENRIPIEMCPTSNIATKSIKTYSQHPFKIFSQLEDIYPMIFCTDDKGVFNSDLSDEWYNMTKAFNITKKFIKELIINSVQFSFIPSQNEKDKLEKMLSEEFERLL